MNKKRKTIAIVCASLLLAVGAGTVLSIQDNTQAVPLKQMEISNKSLFEFTGTDGWRKGPSNKTSMALFGNPSPNQPSSCFASAEYKIGTIDIAIENQKSRDTLKEGGYIVSPLETKILALPTDTGSKEYELHQSNVVSPEGLHKVKGGNAFGYLQLEKGYVKIIGNCDTAAELPSIYPALEALKVSETN